MSSTIRTTNVLIKRRFVTLQNNLYPLYPLYVWSDQLQWNFLKITANDGNIMNIWQCMWFGLVWFGLELQIDKHI